VALAQGYDLRYAIELGPLSVWRVARGETAGAGSHRAEVLLKEAALAPGHGALSAPT
jgi:hypothetical protein